MHLKELAGLSTPEARLVVLPSVLAAWATAGPERLSRVPTPCLVRRLFGRCPTCGVTRAMAALLRADLQPRPRRNLGALVLAVLAGQLAADSRRVLRRGAVAEVETVIDAPPEEVWDDLRDIASHSEWMTDAQAIRFTSDSREGVGTTFECDTKVGPFRFSDPMEVTEWSEGQVMAISHNGMVKGTGRFLVAPAGDGQTRFLWQEHLRFPLYLGGPFGSAAASAVMSLIWKRNLANLKRRLESEPVPST